MTKDHWKRMLGHPVVIAIAVAVFGVLAMLIVDHGPWTRAKVQTAEVANYKTTGDAARAVGARVVLPEAFARDADRLQRYGRIT